MTSCDAIDTWLFNRSPGVDFGGNIPYQVSFLSELTEELLNNSIVSEQYYSVADADDQEVILQDRLRLAELDFQNAIAILPELEEQGKTWDFLKPVNDCNLDLGLERTSEKESLEAILKNLFQEIAARTEYFSTQQVLRIERAVSNIERASALLNLVREVRRRLEANSSSEIWCHDHLGHERWFFTHGNHPPDSLSLFCLGAQASTGGRSASACQ